LRTHPDEILREDFMPDHGLTVTALADQLGVSRQSVNELLRGRRALTPTMAARLARLFGNSPQFWLQAQQARDIWQAEQENRAVLNRIKPLMVAWYTWAQWLQGACDGAVARVAGAVWLDGEQQRTRRTSDKERGMTIWAHPISSCS
jgi:antitoxin HigA-1